MGQCPGGFCPQYQPQSFAYGGGFPAVSSVQGYGFQGYGFGGGGFPVTSYSYGGYGYPVPFGGGSCSGGGFQPSFQLSASPGSLSVSGNAGRYYGGGYGYPSGYGYGGPPVQTYGAGYCPTCPR